MVATGGGVLGLQSTRWYLRKIPTDGGSSQQFTSSFVVSTVVTNVKL